MMNEHAWNSLRTMSQPLRLKVLVPLTSNHSSLFMHLLLFFMTSVSDSISICFFLLIAFSFASWGCYNVDLNVVKDIEKTLSALDHVIGFYHVAEDVEPVVRDGWVHSLCTLSLFKILPTLPFLLARSVIHLNFPSYPQPQYKFGWIFGVHG